MSNFAERLRALAIEGPEGYNPNLLEECADEIERLSGLISDLRHRVIRAAYVPRPMCRDCADRDGTCHDGSKCDSFEDALDRIVKVVPYAGKLEIAAKDLYEYESQFARENGINERRWTLLDRLWNVLAGSGDIPASTIQRRGADSPFGQPFAEADQTSVDPANKPVSSPCEPEPTPVAQSAPATPSGVDEIDTQLAEAKRLNDDWFRANAPGGWIDNLRCSLNAAHAEIRALRAAAEVGTPRT